jgi:hypothetical protein
MVVTIETSSAGCGRCRVQSPDPSFDSTTDSEKYPLFISYVESLGVEMFVSFVLFFADKRERINRYVKMAARIAAPAAAPTAAPAIAPTLVVECWLGLSEVEVSFPKDALLDVKIGVLGTSDGSVVASTTRDGIDVVTAYAASLDVIDAVVVELWLGAPGDCTRFSGLGILYSDCLMCDVSLRFCDRDRCVVYMIYC